MDELSNFEDSLKKLTEQVNNFSVDTQKHTTVFGGLSLYTKSPLVLLAIPVGIAILLALLKPGFVMYEVSIDGNLPEKKLCFKNLIISTIVITIIVAIAYFGYTYNIKSKTSSE